MKKTIAILILLFSLINSGHSQQGYLSYPRAETIYKSFFNSYSVKDIPSMELLQFQKKPDGWHVAVFKTNYDTLIKDELLWSKSTQSYQKINFPPVSSPGENDTYIEQFSTQFKNYYFNFFPYYNYPGFDWDIIQDYANTPNLPDSLLYALGRSYSYFTDNLLNNNSGYSQERFRFNLKDDTNCLSKEQLDKYNKYHNLAVETFQALNKINPKYETMIGSIDVKLADEYMVGYLDMQVYQNEKEASKEIKDNIYDYFMISMAEDYLLSCDSNAVLITFGDNDTYPLLYVQAKYKFRTDVLVVNNELINLSRYINRLRLPFGGAAPLPLTISRDKYKDKTREYIPYYNAPNHPLGNDSSTSLKLVMDFITSDEQKDKLQLMDGEYVNYLPTEKFSLPVNQENVKKSKIMRPNGNQVPEVVLNWKMTKEYLYKGHMILLDILVGNDWKRPICFTNADYDSYLGLGQYLRYQGLVYELVPFKGPSSDPFSNPQICTEDMYNMVVHKFKWGNLASGKYLGIGKAEMASDLRVSALQLANALLNENKKDSAIKVLDLCMDSISAKSCPYEYAMYGMPGAYYRAGKYEKGNSISEKLFAIYKEKLIQNRKPGTPEISSASVPGTNYLTTSSIIDEAKMQLKELIYLAKSNNQDKLFEDYKQQLSALSNKGILSSDEYNNLIN